MYGQDGNDFLEGGRGADTLYGGPNGTGSNPWSDREELYGGRGDDKVYGGGGADYMEGQQGRDRMLGGGGADTLDAADRETAGTPDTVDCGPGTDAATVNTNDAVSNCEDVTEVANP
jgi:Ca2+-binding RTX toxin-like protein